MEKRNKYNMQKRHTPNLCKNEANYIRFNVSIVLTYIDLKTFVRN